MSKCCCRQSCCGGYGGYGGYGYGQGNNFSLLVILVLILIFFGSKYGRRDECGERRGCESGLGLESGIIFIITLYYLACGCGYKQSYCC